MTQIPPLEPPEEPGRASDAPATSSGPTSPPSGSTGTGAPPAPDSGSGGRSRTPLVVVAVLVVLAVVGGGIALLTTGDDDDDDDEVETVDSQRPGSDEADTDASGDSGDAAEAEAVVRQYFEAILDQDCEAMFETVTEATWSDEADSAEDAVNQCEDAVDAGELDFDGEATLDDLVVVDQGQDSVTFEATETINGEQLTESFTVVVEDGDWRIDLS